MGAELPNHSLVFRDEFSTIENNVGTIEAQLILVDSATKIFMGEASVFPAPLNISEGGGRQAKLKTVTAQSSTTESS